MIMWHSHYHRATAQVMSATENLIVDCMASNPASKDFTSYQHAIQLLSECFDHKDGDGDGDGDVNDDGDGDDSSNKIMMVMIEIIIMMTVIIDLIQMMMVMMGDGVVFIQHW